MLYQLSYARVVTECSLALLIVVRRDARRPCDRSAFHDEWFNAVVHSLALFAGLAVIVTLTPGPATALVVRTALRGGRRAALSTTLGNATGVLFAAGRLGRRDRGARGGVRGRLPRAEGDRAVVLVVLGVQSWRRNEPTPAGLGSSGRSFRDGVVTALANPKVAVFFVAVFPQFLSGRRSMLDAGLLMASFIVMLDLVWFSTLALLVTRARRALAGGRWPRRLERVSGTIMIGLGFRLALKLALSGRGRLVGKPMLLGSAAPL